MYTNLYINIKRAEEDDRETVRGTLKMEHPQLQSVRDLPFHQYVGVTGIHPGEGQADLEMEVNERCVNPSGILHGGIIYALCDVACYCALLTLLEPDETAATHGIHVSVMKSARLGDKLNFQGKVFQKGRSTVFLETVVMAGDRVLARASVTKTIIRNKNG